jgi:hypothetical protein
MSSGALPAHLFSFLLFLAPVVLSFASAIAIVATPGRSVAPFGFTVVLANVARPAGSGRIRAVIRCRGALSVS